MAVTQKVLILLLGHMIHIFFWTVLYKILHLMVQRRISMSFRAAGGMMAVITSFVL